MPNPAFEVVNTGPLACFQDAGRRGLLRLGVTTSGFFDDAAATLANRALGNHDLATVLEILMGGLSLRALRPITLIATGALTPLHVRTPLGTTRFEHSHRVIHLDTGDEITVHQPSYGIRTYLAVAGGFAVEDVLGSCSYDTLSGIGPHPLRVGDVLFSRQPIGTTVPYGEVPPAPIGHTTEVHVIPGPREDWFTRDAVDYFYTTTFDVTSDSDRIGIRLNSPLPLARAISHELPSEGMVRGAIQVPPDGQPVIFGPDHPVTGGYPVIGVVSSASMSALAQLSPGSQVRFSRNKLH